MEIVDQIIWSNKEQMPDIRIWNCIGYGLASKVD